MSKIILYTNHCPKCSILENKLKAKGVEYIQVNSLDAMIEKGFMEMPKLEIDGKIHSFSEAISYVNSL